MQDKVTLTEANEVLEFWKAFNLSNQREQLDKICTEVRDLKTNSINGRKKLNDITKSFRNKSKDDQVNDLTDLLKSYQEEIDQLSRRSKFCEASFLNLYRSIHDATDPVPVIEFLIQSLSSSSIHQLDIERLKGEISQYEEEFQQLKNQDITIRRLEDQINEYKLKIEDKVSEEVTRRVLEIEEQADNRIASIYEIQKAAEKRLVVAVEAMKQAQSSAERAQSQLYEVSSQAENRMSSLAVENSMLLESSERLTARIAELENEIHSFKNSVNTTAIMTMSKSTTQNANTTNNTTNSAITDNDDIQTLKLVIQELRNEIRHKDDVLRAEKLQSDQLFRDISLQLTREKELVIRTRQELSTRPLKEDYIAAKRQLKLLQKITFHIQDDEDDDIDPENTGPLDDKMKLDVLLATRLRQLDADMAELRREVKQLQQKEVSSKDTIISLRRSLEASSNLITRLELDLESQTRINQTHAIQLHSLGLGSGGSGGSGNNAIIMDEFQMMTASTDDGSRNSSNNNSNNVYNRNNSNNNKYLHLKVRGGGGGGGGGGTFQQHDTENNLQTAAPTSTAIAASTTAMMMTPNSASVVQDVKTQYPVSSSGNDSTIITTPASATNATAGATNSSSSMVTIIQGQRDRYKQKLVQVESQLVEAQRQLKIMTECKLQTESDNTALYAKIRYLQSYQSQSNGGYNNSSSSSGNSGLNYKHWHTDVDSPALRTGIPGMGMRLHAQMEHDTNDVEKRYYDMYEQKMNPFAEFSKNEKQRRLQELSVPDRIVLNTTMAFVSNQTGRRLIVIYLSAMHLLVFFVLYYITHFVHYGCDPSIPASPHNQ